MTTEIIPKTIMFYGDNPNVMHETVLAPRTGGLVDVKKRKSDALYDTTTPAVINATLKSHNQYHTHLCSLRIDKRREFIRNVQKRDDRKKGNSRKKLAKYQRVFKEHDEATTRAAYREAVLCNTISTSISIPSSNRSNKSAFERDGGLPEIPDYKLESIPTELINDGYQDSSTEYKLVELNCELPEFGISLNETIKKNNDVFSSTLSSTSANLEEFHLEIKDDEWYVPKNHRKRGGTDRERQDALTPMLDQLEKSGIIEPVNASHYSHGFLVPKPNGKWRLVVDFKNINNATTKHRKWPIPNIKEMLNRIGLKKPKYFAVFDLTQGYYQCPISEASRKYTAFMTHRKSKMK